MLLELVFTLSFHISLIVAEDQRNRCALNVPRLLKAIYLGRKDQSSSVVIFYVRLVRFVDNERADHFDRIKFISPNLECHDDSH
jgi:hypothetical protein